MHEKNNVLQATESHGEHGRIPLSHRSRRLIFVTVAVLTTTALLAVYVVTRRSVAVDQASDRARVTTWTQTMVTSAIVQQIESDVSALAGMPVVREYVEQRESEAVILRAHQTFLSFVIAKKIYDQARILGSDGQELLRVNRTGTGAEVVPSVKLQDKSHRYYFTDGIAAEPGTWYVSAFDLNVEEERIEIPRKPMIRLASPIVIDGTTEGLLVLNLLGEVILERFRDATEGEPGIVGLANADGWWLYVDDLSREWGNMYPQLDIGSVESKLGSHWDEIRQKETVTNVADGWLVSAQRITPFTGATASSRIGHWYVIYHGTTQDLGIDILSVLRTALPMYFLLLVVAVTAAWVLADATHDRNRYRAHIERAVYMDELTGIPNRRYLFDQLERQLDIRRRYGHQFSVLFLDLDGFKLVNDSIGHDAGDEVLRVVAKRLKGCIRASDSVARLGGDEFVVILAETTDRGPGERVATEILMVIHEAIPVPGGEAQVGTSIGVVWTGDARAAVTDETKGEEIIRIADQMMYQAKISGKNRAFWAGA